MQGLKEFARLWVNKMAVSKAFSREYILLQNKSVILYSFLDKYNQLEILIRNLFESHLSSFKSELINELYFYYGGRIGTFIEYETNSIKLSNITFNKQETFKSLTINQIIKVCREKKCIAVFQKEIKSLKKPNTRLILCDCLLKFLNMRNSLAHELADISFKDKDFVELLSDKILNTYSEKEFVNIDSSNLDFMSKHILSNIIYMDIVMSELS